MKIDYDHLVDASNDECPIPTIKTKNALDALPVGKVLKLVTGAEGSVKNIRTFANNNSCELLSEAKNGEGFHFYIRKI